MTKKTSKDLLIVKACGIASEDDECKNIATQAGMYGIEVDMVSPKTSDDLIAALNSGKKYDYLYLSSHGDINGVCNHSKSIQMSWFELGLQLCGSMCMKENCILMLSCCRGGLNQIAYDLFYCCMKIAYIVGPRQNLPAQDMLIAFNILLYNVAYRQLDPVVAAEKIRLATDIRFVCFDQLEIQGEYGYWAHTAQYAQEMIDESVQAKEKANELIIPNDKPL